MLSVTGACGRAPSVAVVVNSVGIVGGRVWDPTARKVTQQPGNGDFGLARFRVG